jgi:hypothetical protein
MLAHASCKLGVLASFYINRSVIMETLCINKYNAKSQCKGTCQLKKKLEDFEFDDVKIPNLLKNIEDINLFFEDKFFTLSSQFYFLISLIKKIQLVFYQDVFLDNLFPPPEVFNWQKQIELN